ncbi:active regulator of SIRT1 [Salminus brasiliensis]|uniref:active regulator of SIRT1 n=1 Tax=Salminus brasiliensis TaxID=930266 RepID=UPI003B838F80
MSASVVRRGLELLSDDIKGAGSSQKKKQSSKKASLMAHISTNRQGVRKQIRHLQTHGKTVKSKATVKDKHIKNALEEYRKKQKKSQLSSNLKYFLGTQYKTEEICTRKIQQQNSGRLSHHRPDKSVSKAQEESIFTEEEFQKFQEEYFSKH